MFLTNNVVLGNHGKIEIVDGKVIYYDANDNRVPLNKMCEEVASAPCA